MIEWLESPDKTIRVMSHHGRPPAKFYILNNIMMEGEIDIDDSFTRIKDSEIKPMLKILIERRFGTDWKIARIKSCCLYGKDSDLNTGRYHPEFAIYGSTQKIWGINGCLYKDGELAEPLED